MTGFRRCSCGHIGKGRSTVVLLALFGSLAAFDPPAVGDPPAALQDFGDAAIEPSQGSSFRGASGRTYRLRSWFEQMSVFAVGGISVEDVRALAAEVDRLKQNACYSVVIRSLVTARAVNQAVSRCDLVYILAHGQRQPPYLSFGGRRDAGTPTSGPAPVNAQTVFIGSCHGQAIATALGQPYKTLPPGSFQADGTSFRRDIIRAVTTELAALRDTQCEVPKVVCILAGVQELNVQ